MIRISGSSYSLYQFLNLIELCLAVQGKEFLTETEKKGTEIYKRDVYEILLLVTTRYVCLQSRYYILTFVECFLSFLGSFENLLCFS